MLRFTVALLPMSFVCSLDAGCSVDECDKHPERIQCQNFDMGMGENLNISSRRLSISGDTVNTTLSNKIHRADVVRINQIGATELDLEILDAGKIVVTAKDLHDHNFIPGKASMQIGENSALDIRFFLTPDIAVTPMKISTGNDEVTWLGVAKNRIIYALNYNALNTPPVHFNEYGYISLASTYSRGSIYPAATRGFMLNQSIYTGYLNPYRTTPKIDLQSCPDTISNCSVIQTNSADIDDLAVNMQATLLVAILDKKLTAYNIQRSFDNNAVSQTIDAISNPSLIGIGDFNDDGKSDLIIWDNLSEKISILDGNNSFAINAELTSQVDVARGTDILTHLFIRDMDNDGLDDIIYTTNNQITWLSNQVNSTDGITSRFAKGNTVLVTAANIDSLAVGDIDVGKIETNDLVIASRIDKSIQIFLNQATY